jgi:Protein of unknown function (DUF3095)
VKEVNRATGYLHLCSFKQETHSTAPVLSDRRIEKATGKIMLSSSLPVQRGTPISTTSKKNTAGGGGYSSSTKDDTENTCTSTTNVSGGGGNDNENDNDNETSSATINDDVAVVVAVSSARINDTTVPAVAAAAVPTAVVNESPEEDCYLSLPSFSDYREICDARHYRRLPRDWVVIVTDIAGSTQLIESGRYRDVNTVGAMPIAAVRNVLFGSDTIPYVFGGDGATMVVRPAQLDPAMSALMGVQRLVAANYNIRLRVGCVSVATLEEKGAAVLVARLAIAPNTIIAMFSGRGLALADDLIKSGTNEWTPPPPATTPDRHGVRDSSNTEPDLTGLSCRWNKIPNRNGCVLSLLVATCPTTGGGTAVTTAADDDGSNERRIYQEVLDQLSQIIDLDEQNAANNTSNPVNMDLAHYKTAGQMLKEEKRMHTDTNKTCGGGGNVAWWTRKKDILMCHVLFYWQILQKSVLDVPAYTNSMRVHADHRKFDDMIRMVVDCSKEQVGQITSVLDELHRQGKICYGLHQSEHSLLTCLVENAQKGQHVHFVDGDTGGYALAAKQLKLQLKQQKAANDDHNSDSDHIVI